METFIELFDEVIQHGTWGNRSGNRESFAAASGVSKSYLSEIFSGTKLPTQEALASWCVVAGVNDDDAARLIYTLARDKALKSDDTRAFVEAADARLAKMHAVLIRLSALVSKKGLKIPKDLVKMIEAVDVKD